MKAAIQKIVWGIGLDLFALRMACIIDSLGKSEKRF
jgi:hypothetical protein